MYNQPSISDLKSCCPGATSNQDSLVLHVPPKPARRGLATAAALLAYEVPLFIEVVEKNRAHIFERISIDDMKVEQIEPLRRLVS